MGRIRSGLGTKDFFSFRNYGSALIIILLILVSVVVKQGEDCICIKHSVVVLADGKALDKPVMWDSLIEGQILHQQPFPSVKCKFFMPR